MTAVDRQMFALTLGNKSTRDRNRGTRNGRERERERRTCCEWHWTARLCLAGQDQAHLWTQPYCFPLRSSRSRLIVSPHALSRCFFATPSPVSCNASRSSYEVITSLKNPSSPPPSPRGMLATRKENTNARARAYARCSYSWPTPNDRAATA
jgi:hypothetical protein